MVFFSVKPLEESYSIESLFKKVYNPSTTSYSEIEETTRKIISKGSNKGYIRLDTNAICLERLGSHGVAVIALDELCDKICSTLSKCVLPKLGKLLVESLLLERCVDRILVVIISVEEFLECYFAGRKYIKSVAVVNGKVRMIQGSEFALPKYKPRCKHEVVLRYEHGFYVAAIPFKEHIIY